jgi:hypothetical protein
MKIGVEPLYSCISLGTSLNFVIDNFAKGLIKLCTVAAIHEYVLVGENF